MFFALSFFLMIYKIIVMKCLMVCGSPCVLFTECLRRGGDGEAIQPEKG
jgi:hypothetical protein